MLVSVLRSRSRSKLVLVGRNRSHCRGLNAKTLFSLLFRLFLYAKEAEPVKEKYLEPEPVKKGPAPQHCLGDKLGFVLFVIC